VSFASITLCVASQRVFIVVVVYFVDLVWKLLDTPLYISITSICICLMMILNVFSNKIMSDCGVFAMAFQP